MVWRRVQISDGATLRELHGVIQVAMGWEGIHLYQFRLRSRCCGSWELCASSPDVTLASLKQWTRRGAHLLLQTRTRTLDGTLRPLFERWYPGLANDNFSDTASGQIAAA